MDPSNFYYFVLPLGVLVFLNAALAFKYARKEERAQLRVANLVNEYVKESSKQKESYTEQLQRLQYLYKTGNLDEVTYERMKLALENSLVKSQEETKMKMKLRPAKGKDGALADGSENRDS